MITIIILDNYRRELITNNNVYSFEVCCYKKIGHYRKIYHLFSSLLLCTDEQTKQTRNVTRDNTIDTVTM